MIDEIDQIIVTMIDHDLIVSITIVATANFVSLFHLTFIQPY